MWHAVKAALLIVLCSFWPGASSAREPSIVVVGLADAAIDRAAIQAAIDRAPAGSIVALRGIFHFDGTPVVVHRGNITLAGHAVDDDGDGRVNEDWADGQDNDQDGNIDEDDWNTLLVGTVDASGRPRPDQPAPARFNHAFVVRGATQSLANIHFRDLALRAFWRALSFSPDLDLGRGTTCQASARTSGALVDLHIEGNRFEDNDLAIELVGAVRLARIRHNVLSGTSHLALHMTGGSRACTEATGELGGHPIGRPTGVQLEGNRIHGTEIALMSTGSRATTIRNNDIRARATGVAIQGDDGARIAKNTFHETTIGIHASEPVDGGLIAGNIFVRPAIGILFDTGAAGYAAMRNTFLEVAEVDILLDEATTNNVIVHDRDAVRDLGKGNQVKPTR